MPIRCNVNYTVAENKESEKLEPENQKKGEKK